ncbi:MAG TPA: hypothetical protein VI757_02550 [Bacteroidia bacterium]|nr:hypothetical protein [Bacteroidia bacterium]
MSGKIISQYRNVFGVKYEIPARVVIFHIGIFAFLFLLIGFLCGILFGMFRYGWFRNKPLSVLVYDMASCELNSTCLSADNRWLALNVPRITSDMPHFGAYAPRFALNARDMRSYSGNLTTDVGDMRSDTGNMKSDTGNMRSYIRKSVSYFQYLSQKIKISRYAPPGAMLRSFSIIIPIPLNS